MSVTTDGLSSLSAAAKELVGDVGSFVDGRWEAGDGSLRIESMNPTSGSALGEISAASVAQTEAAIAGARRASDAGEWAQASAKERSEYLVRLAELMEQYREALVEIVVTEVGCPIKLAQSMQVGMPIANIRWSAEMAVKGPQGGYEQMLPIHEGPPASLSMLVRQPAGVVAGITGYNFPINSIAWKLGPGLAAGCSLVLKPSERTFLSAVALIRLVEKAGLPKGTVNLVLGGGEVGTTLSEHPDVDLVMFTGSLTVGQKIMKVAADSTKRLVLELGGKSATLVLPDSPIEDIVGPSILRWARNSGQGCGATTRTLVPRGDYERFVAASADYIDHMVVGDPFDERTDLGPLIREEQRQSVEGYVAGALDAGAEIVAGGGRPDRDGYFMNPTVVGNVTNADVICQEELFGPVGTVIPYDSVEEAIAIADNSKYGLHAAVYGPISESIEIAKRLKTGAVSVNGGGFMHPNGPWGGYKRSGFGREMGEDGFREFFEVKHIQWPLK